MVDSLVVRFTSQYHRSLICCLHTAAHLPLGSPLQILRLYPLQCRAGGARCRSALASASVAWKVLHAAGRRGVFSSHTAAANTAGSSEVVPHRQSAPIAAGRTFCSRVEVRSTANAAFYRVSGLHSVGLLVMRCDHMLYAVCLAAVHLGMADSSSKETAGEGPGEGDTSEGKTAGDDEKAAEEVTEAYPLAVVYCGGQPKTAISHD